MVRRGVFVGRFQPLHNGHMGAIKDMLEKVDELVIVVGSSQYSHRMENPFTVGERITMIREALKEEGIPTSRCWIVPVPDVHIHMIWVAQVVGYTPKFDIVYTNEPLTRRLFIEAGFKVEPVPFHEREVYSATEIRKRIMNGEDWEELVPKCVAQFIKEVGGVERLRDLAKTDKIT
ncbi:MAG: Nicotinamide-nucleotide adenylyltransferase [Candidatus Bathyarchaeota archaeon BA1]|nr:MAG: Nicotinamide-nucleotide adenylyltransferase [Candidatus Bathyarchaeota archaeon BA1]